MKNRPTLTTRKARILARAQARQDLPQFAPYFPARSQNGSALRSTHSKNKRDPNRTKRLRARADAKRRVYLRALHAGASRAGVILPWQI